MNFNQRKTTEFNDRFFRSSTRWNFFSINLNIFTPLRTAIFDFITIQLNQRFTRQHDHPLSINLPPCKTPSKVTPTSRKNSLNSAAAEIKYRPSQCEKFFGVKIKTLYPRKSKIFWLLIKHYYFSLYTSWLTDYCVTQRRIGTADCSTGRCFVTKHRGYKNQEYHSGIFKDKTY